MAASRHGSLAATGATARPVILEGGDFVYIPSGAIHVIANASATEEASLIFCYIGVGNTGDAQTVWLDQTPGGGTGNRCRRIGR